ncbi:TetR/AcrR family transcriptional regulator C-terminal domain-containing protein [Streptomyces flaveolus]|uniref:TetR/AcrR family transcriptional regulator C-terminal domain-containing protein n=1 Tax=Streptomyces flaveolus TaxID=67297 RepID=UPI003D9E0D1E
MDARRQAEHPGGDRAPLLLVAVQEPVRGVTREHRAELPPQVVGVLHADEMATEMYRRMIAAGSLDPGDTWRERLLKSNRGLRASLLGYRDGAKVFSGSRFTGLEHAEQMEDSLRLFTAAGFTLAQAVRATSTTYVYTLGFVTEEQGVAPLPDQRREGYDMDERARRMADFPLSAAAGAEIFEDYDRHFEEGLALVIDGIAARYGRG